MILCGIIIYIVGDIVEIRNGKLIVSNAGGTASNGAKTYKASLPTAWLNSLELNEKNKRIELCFDGEKIIIRPEITLEDFITAAKKENHKLLKLNYYNKADLCTVIVADYSNQSVRFKNFTDNSLYTAFGIKQNISWDDYNSFLEERCVSKNRMGIKEYLASIGVDDYEPIEIIKKTKGKMAEDYQRIEVEKL